MRAKTRIRRSPICVDVSFVLELVTSGGYRPAVVQLWSGWHESGRPLAAPTLLHYEASHALARYIARGELLPDEAAQALEAVLGLGITLYDDADLHRQALDLAGRLSLPTTHAAHYLALAERLGAEFWTADRRLAEAVRRELPWVHLAE